MKRVKQHKDIKPLRIILSVLLAIISVICFSSYVYLNTVRVATSQNIFVEVFENVNILDAKLGSIADNINYDGIDEDSTVSETMAIAISETAHNEFGYDISREEVEEILEDDQLREDIGNVSGDVISGMITGKLDSEQLADDVEDMIDNNKEVIEEISGQEITDEMMDQIHDKISEMETSTSNTVASEQMTNIRKIYSNTMVYGFLCGGILCVIGIMLLNMFKLPTGFRTNGIAFIVNSVFMGIGGLVLRVSPKLILALASQILNNNSIVVNTSVLNDVVDNYAKALARQYFIPAAIFLVLGIACMVTQGVLLSVYRKKKDLL